MNVKHNNSKVIFRQESWNFSLEINFTRFKFHEDYEFLIWKIERNLESFQIKQLFSLFFRKVFPFVFLPLVFFLLDVTRAKHFSFHRGKRNWGNSLKWFSEFHQWFFIIREMYFCCTTPDSSSRETFPPVIEKQFHIFSPCSREKEKLSFPNSISRCIFFKLVIFPMRWWSWCLHCYLLIYTPSDWTKKWSFQAN